MKIDPYANFPRVSSTYIQFFSLFIRYPGKQKRRQPIITESANGTNTGTTMELQTTNRADFNFKRPSPCPPAKALIREKGNLAKLKMLPFDYRSTFQV